MALALERLKEQVKNRPPRVITPDHERLARSVPKSELGRGITYQAGPGAVLLQYFIEGTDSEDSFNHIWLRMTEPILSSWLRQSGLGQLDILLFNALLFESHNYFQSTCVYEEDRDRFINPKQRASRSARELRKTIHKLRDTHSLLEEVGQQWPIDSAVLREVRDDLENFMMFLETRERSLSTNTPILFSSGKYRAVKVARYADTVQTVFLFNICECFHRIGGFTRERSLEMAADLMAYEELPGRWSFDIDTIRVRFQRESKRGRGSLASDWRHNYRVLFNTLPKRLQKTDAGVRLSKYLKGNKLA